LQLNDNLIEYIHDNISAAPFLSVLNLNKNKLYYLPNMPKSLTIINISNNELINMDFLNSCLNLKELYMNNNLLPKLDLNCI